MSTSRFPCGRAAVASALLCIAASAGPAAAQAPKWSETVVLPAGQPIEVRAPPDVSGAYVVAVGGRGGNEGGYGATVTGALAFDQYTRLRGQVAQNGGFGDEPFVLTDGGRGGSPAAGAGGGMTALWTTRSQFLLVAAGGGGRGAAAPGDPATRGGAGGDAGADGADGSASAGALSARGGRAGSSQSTGAPGVGSARTPGSLCPVGTAGGLFDAPEAGGPGPGNAPEPGGGGGGDGVWQGGGGGGGVNCATSTSGAGGGGGASLVPGGGTLAVDTSGQPSLTLTWIHEKTPPAFRVVTPQPGQRIPAHARTSANFSCSDETGGSGLAACIGSIPQGGRLSNGVPGAYALTITAYDNWGNAATTSIPYTVIDDTPPVITRATVRPRTLKIRSNGGRRSRAQGVLQVRLSEPAARVLVVAERRVAGTRVRGSCVVPARRRGPGCLKWRYVTQIESHDRHDLIALRGRWLRPGDYRLTLIATDADGINSRAVRTRFAVRVARGGAPPRRAGGRGPR